MLSTGKNDFKEWTQKDKIIVRNQFLNGDGLDKIGKNCHRHAKNVCLELMRQGLIQEENNIAKNHIRFETPYNLRYARKLDYDTSSEYTPSECDSEEDLSDYESECSDCPSICSETNEITEVDTEANEDEFDLYNIKQQVDILFDNVRTIRNYLKSFVK
jgi:hypothetical protein